MCGDRGVTGRLRHLPVLLAGTAVLLVLGAALGWAARGPVGALGAAAGVALVAAGYTASTLAIAWADSVSPKLVLPVGMSVYGAKVGLFAGMMIALGPTGWAGLVPMAMGIVAGVVGWIATQIWWTVRTAHPYANRTG